MEQYVNMENNTSSQIHHHNNTTTSTSQSHLLTALPSPDFQPAKRPTRQWAAWTRQEEESFFTALRLVGKNFEKITCRVQTKNKDQVRHYYYRLVRRINKLLAPTFSLDAKNSKDTNAAMLRWWSLLEKYSCKASKLHLKPRRFKLFIEALEHQLVKDRKKNVRKRSPPDEICCASPTTSPNQNKLCAADVQAVKSDGQSVERGAHRKGCTTRRHLSMGVSHNISKEDFSLTKPTRPRRRSGTISAAAMKRWEKAAIAGVSLVADAAEHLERTACEKQNYHHCGLNVLSIGCSMEKFDSSLKEVQSPLPNLSNDVQNNVKLKLQLFPIDESTRKALEGDKHNPHLELTVGGRKKITSILEHLDRKWGSSSAASGQLMLFPFIIRRQDLLKYERWTKDSAATAAHVYALSGSPPVFRLRYGWILSSELQAAMSHAEEEINSLETLHAGNDQTSEMNENVHGNPPNNGLETFDTAARFPTKSTQSCDVSITKRLEVEVDQEIRAGEWADSLTNVIVGDVLSDGMDASCVGVRVFESSQCLGEIPFTCDSFDAAIAAHICNHNKMSVSGLSSSIWDAEETCDAFSFQHNKLVTPTDNMIEEGLMNTTTVAGVEMNRGVSAGNKVQELEEKGMVEDSDDGEPMEETKNCEKEIGNLTDICWPDSLGPLELDAPKCKYYSEDVILSDSMSGLNRLIASSLDAFQNCPFFGLDDKDKAHSSSSSSSFTATGQQSLQAL